MSENYANDAGRDKVEFQLIFAIEGEADNRNDGSCSDVVVTLDFDGQSENDHCSVSIGTLLTGHSSTNR